MNHLSFTLLFLEIQNPINIYLSATAFTVKPHKTVFNLISPFIGQGKTMTRRLFSKIFGGIEVYIANVAITYNKNVMSPGFKALRNRCKMIVHQRSWSLY